MRIRSVNAPDAPSAVGGYSQVCEVSGAQRLAFVSGQVPEFIDGDTPGVFAEQCRLIWRNIEAQLRAVDMTLDNVVKVTTFLSDRQFAGENSAVRAQMLGNRSPALTVIIAGIFDPTWLLEIEVVAAA